MSTPQGQAAPPPIRQVIRRNLSQKHKAEAFATVVAITLVNWAVELHLEYKWMGVLLGTVMLLKDAVLILFIAEEEGWV